jgi:co-chaperonin GroES (HSP10)
MVIHRSVLDDDKADLNATDPDIEGFHLKGHNILVMPVKVSNKTKYGVHLSDNTKDDVQYLTNMGKVLSFGPRAYVQDIYQESGPACKVGDYVLIPKLAGQKIKYKGVTLTIVPCDRVIAVIDDPKDFDPNFTITNY